METFANKFAKAFKEVAPAQVKGKVNDSLLAVQVFFLITLMMMTMRVMTMMTKNALMTEIGKMVIMIKIRVHLDTEVAVDNIETDKQRIHLLS